MMSYLAALACVVFFTLLQTLTDAQGASYAMWFQPGVQITKLSSTMVVPKVSTGSGYHAIWPGLENDSNSFVYQNVLSDSMGTGRWMFWVEYCCNPDFKHDPIAVSPGDTITSTLSYSGSQWSSSYVISGSTSANGGFTDAAVASYGLIDKALLAIELTSGGTWDFGQIQWTNLQITAATTSVSWCGNSFTTSGSLSYTVSGTSNSVSGSSATCAWSSILFKAPS